MNNLTDLAFPFIEPSNHENGSVSTGFTKHELATIMIAGQLANKQSYSTDDLPHIANVAYKLAAEVLSKF